MQEQMHTLAQEIIGAYEARVSSLAPLRARVSTQLQELDRAHNAMARRQRAELARGRADLTQVEARRKSEVEGWLREVADSHQAMARRQRAELARRRADLTQVEGWRKSEVEGWLRGVTDTHQAAQREWQHMAAILQARRTGGTAVAEAPARAAVEAVATPPVAEAAEKKLGNGGLVDQIFAYLADRPDGTRLTELEDEFGASRFEIARIIRRLTDEGKVEKRDLLYFAI